MVCKRKANDIMVLVGKFTIREEWLGEGNDDQMKGNCHDTKLIYSQDESNVIGGIDEERTIFIRVWSTGSEEVAPPKLGL